MQNSAERIVDSASGSTGRTATAAAGRPRSSPAGRPGRRLLAAARPDGLPDPRACCGRLAQAVAEVLVGVRPASQLADHASLDVRRQLERSAGRLISRGGAATQRPVLRSVHLAEPTPGVIEACAVVVIGPRARALALRLDAIRGEWQCTALQLA